MFPAITLAVMLGVLAILAMIVLVKLFEYAEAIIICAIIIGICYLYANGMINWPL